jgi:hypothetical protein
MTLDRETLQEILLWCGVLSSLWYAAINVFVPLTWPEYSVVDLTVSELSAIGAPTRALWVALAMPYTPPFALFGWGVLRSASDNRWLRITGWLILVYSAFNCYWCHHASDFRLPHRARRAKRRGESSDTVGRALRAH